MKDLSQIKEQIKKEIKDKTHIFKEENMRLYANILIELYDQTYDENQKEIFREQREEYFLKFLSKAKLENVFHTAAAIGSIEIVEAFISIAKKSELTLQNMIADNEWIGFIYAAEGGHLGVIKLLWNNATDDQKQNMIAVKNYAAFRGAALRGHIEVVKFIWNNATNYQKQKMITAEQYEAFSWAAASHLGVIEFLWNNATNYQKHKMLTAYEYAAFRNAAQYGRLEVIKFLWNNATGDQKYKMINAYMYAAFRWAAAGHLEVMKFLWNNATADQKYKMVNVYEYEAFRNGAKFGQLEVIKFVWNNVTADQQQKMITAEQYAAFRWAAERGHFEVLKHLYMVAEDIAPPLIEFQKIHEILFKNIKDFNLKNFQKEVAEYKFNYINNSIFDAVKSLKSFILKSKNIELTLSFTSEGKNQINLTLPKEITKHILSYVIGDNGLSDKDKNIVIEQLNENKQKIFTPIKQEKQEKTTKYTFIEQIKASRINNNRKILSTGLKTNEHLDKRSKIEYENQLTSGF